MSPITETTTELLAPAGDWESLRAAAANGANAVYLGLAEFNARHRATNFTLAELPEVVAFAHQRDVRVYITFNTLVFSNELDEAVRQAAAALTAGADALIVQDLGLAALVRRMAPEAALHASTQMTLTESRGVEWARRRLGIDRVILARELSLDDIRGIRAQTAVPVEVFVHGALCVAYSGQCLTSEALGARSANRGQCAQACRLPYELIVDGQPRELGDVAYLLSPRDLAAHGEVAALVDAGVRSLKIEGRLKSAAYVAATTQVYREALDAAEAHEPFKASPTQLIDLEQSFSRGFSPGFLEGPDHQRLVEGRSPKARGVLIGRVVRRAARGVIVELEGQATLKPGDGVVFDEGHPEQDEQGGRVFAARAVAGRTRELEIEFGQGQVNLAALTTGSRVWRTDDPAIRRRLARSFAADECARRTPITWRLDGTVGGPLRVTGTTPSGLSAEATWPGPLAEATRHPLDRATAELQLGRLGDTPFELGNVELALDGALMVPKSVLNALRREVVEQLLCQRRTAPRVAIDTSALGRWREQIVQSRTEVNEKNSYQPPPCANESPVRQLHVLTRTEEQLEAAIAWSRRNRAGQRREAFVLPGLVYCDFEDPRRYRDAVARGRDAGIEVAPATLRIMKPGDESWLRMLLRAEPSVVLVRNLASLEMIREAGARFVLDYSLNVANELTADLLAGEGALRLTPSYDLNWEQMAALLRRSNVRWEVVVHQHMPMFHMEHCVFAHLLSEGKDWRDCGRPCDRHRVELRDRVGSALPLVADAGCRNTVFNSVAQSAAEYLPRLLALGMRDFRVELLREVASEVSRLLELYAQALAGEQPPSAVWRALRAESQLGVTRGTLQVIS